MSVCDIRCFNEANKCGYVAILSSRSGGKVNAVKYNGVDFGFNFNPITPAEMSQLRIKTIRSAKEFGRYIKEINSNIMINPINVNGIVFDLPFMYYNNAVIARWTPLFEKDVSQNSFNILSEGLIVEYNFQQPIFVSVLDAKRHIPKTNSERLLVNCANGVVTRAITKAEAERYLEASYHLMNGSWVCDSYEEAPIAGYKLR